MTTERSTRKLTSPSSLPERLGRDRTLQSRTLTDQTGIAITASPQPVIAILETRRDIIARGKAGRKPTWNDGWRRVLKLTSPRPLPSPARTHDTPGARFDNGTARRDRAILNCISSNLAPVRVRARSGRPVLSATHPPRLSPARATRIRGGFLNFVPAVRLIVVREVATRNDLRPRQPLRRLAHTTVPWPHGATRSAFLLNHPVWPPVSASKARRLDVATLASRVETGVGHVFSSTTRAGVPVARRSVGPVENLRAAVPLSVGRWAGRRPFSSLFSPPESTGQQGRCFLSFNDRAAKCGQRDSPVRSGGTEIHRAGRFYQVARN